MASIHEGHKHEISLVYFTKTRFTLIPAHGLIQTVLTQRYKHSYLII